ncbi:MAG TPA: hypothetical protein VHQ46_07085 [Desulfobacteria bacterium]|nr:hypothetical protein [Desulfobacteria bacterium]
MTGLFNTILSLAMGITMFLAGCLIFYLGQKHLFIKYRNRTANAMDVHQKSKP